ncbi:MAG TPA: diacylglycerol kinase [Usitatibacter sp.]|jgi:diacylglycerol kinase (ATP)|nr:diacylglycerol kinase [Usitatibacter sp.]
MAAREPGKSDEGIPNPFKGRTGIARVWHAFRNSCAGVSGAFRNESAFRQEVVLAAILIPIACVLDVTRLERALLVGTVLLLLVVELLNAGIETAIDRISFELHPLSKRAKDMGSAAVLLTLALVALVWASILWPLLF